MCVSCYGLMLKYKIQVICQFYIFSLLFQWTVILGPSLVVQIVCCVTMDITSLPVTRSIAYNVDLILIPVQRVLPNRKNVNVSKFDWKVCLFNKQKCCFNCVFGLYSTLVYCGTGFEGHSSCTLCKEGFVKGGSGTFMCQECTGNFTSNVARTDCTECRSLYFIFIYTFWFVVEYFQFKNSKC